MRRSLVVLLCVLPAAVRTEEPSTAVSFVNERTINAPIADVWKVWSTSQGYTATGVALADVDLRVGGLIRSRYRADGTLGDSQTIENEILAFEPPRMLAIRIHKTPANFPFKEAWKRRDARQHRRTRRASVAGVPSGRPTMMKANNFGSKESSGRRRLVSQPAQSAARPRCARR